MNKINIKNTKTISEYITIRSNNKLTLYSYTKLNIANDTVINSKSLFNKYAFIEYLKSINIKKSIIQEIENI